jgi:predicted alpha/beta-hydrolase family hydrolase
VEIVTSEGPAWVEIDHPGGDQPGGGRSGGGRGPGSPASGSPASGGGSARPVFLLVLTHGAGGGVEAPDLLAARDAALRLGGVVARVTQPYRVKGRRAPGSAARQDAAWVEVVMAMRDAVGAVFEIGGQEPESRQPDPALPLIQGGRSNGARVACRTARAVGARGVVALAFPLHPPGRPEHSRATELREAGTDVLVVNGDRDPFGVPDQADATRVVVLAGESHALSRRPQAVADAVGSWLRQVLSTAARGSGGQGYGRGV